MFKIEDPKKKPEYNQEVLSEFTLDVLNLVCNAIKDRVIRDIVPSVKPDNFLGEAEEYLKQKGLIYSKADIYATAIQARDEFVQQAPNLVYVEGTKLVINSSLSDYEFGSIYKPTLKLITKSFEVSLREAARV